jgi:hypothetical protein
MPGEGCGGGGGGPDQPDCFTSCTCDSTYHMSCETDCAVDASAPPPPPPPPPTGICPDYAVPDICEVCSNGTTECAHAILVNGSCETEICPGTVGTLPQ